MRAVATGKHVQQYIGHGKIGLAPRVPHVTNIRCIMHVRWPGEVSPRQRYNTFATGVVASIGQRTRTANSRLLLSVHVVTERSARYSIVNHCNGNTPFGRSDISRRALDFCRELVPLREIQVRVRARGYEEGSPILSKLDPRIAKDRLTDSRSPSEGHPLFKTRI